MLELSVVIIIVGILSFIFVSNYAVYKDIVSEIVTKNRIKDIRRALVNYAKINGRLPCPSDITVSYKNTTYGDENISSNECVDSISNNNNVAIGGVPYKVLKLNKVVSLDGWSDKIMYAIGKQIGNKNSADLVIYEDSSKIVNMDLSNNLVLRIYNGSVLSSSVENLAFAILSHGKNRNGAWGKTSNIKPKTNYHSANQSYYNVEEKNHKLSTNGTRADFGNELVLAFHNPIFDDIIYYTGYYDLIREIEGVFVTPHLCKYAREIRSKNCKNSSYVAECYLITNEMYRLCQVH